MTNKERVEMLMHLAEIVRGDKPLTEDQKTAIALSLLSLANFLSNVD